MWQHETFSFTDLLNKANNANQKSNQITRKANDLVQKISRQDILKLLDKLGIQSANGKQSNCNKLGKIPINGLKQRLQELDAATNVKKAELQEWLFNMLLGRDVKLIETTSEMQNNASDKAIKNDDLVWNKEA